ncbi:MAG: HAD-IA family hydrolase [Candidatus Woesearchaeota archaeon]
MKLIIFDFDGTIANTIPVAIKVGNELAPKYLKQKIDFKRIFYEEGMHALITETKLSKFKIPFIVRRFRKEMKLYFGAVKLNPGMKGLIKKLKSEGYAIGIITSNSKHNVTSFLKKNYMSDYFDFVKTNVSLFTKAWKIRRIMRKYKVSKKQSYIIGDEVRDILAAKKAGIRSIAVTWGMNSKTLLKKQRPSAIVDNAEQIYRFIKKN